MKKGRLIVIEGPDGTGKETQTALVVERLAAEHAVVSFSFPDYSSPYGRLIRQFLNGESPTHDPLYLSLLYAADRAAKADHIRTLLEQGTWVVCDRYTPSNLAHQLARLPEGDRGQREGLAAWIESTEYQVLGIPQPETVIILKVEPEVSWRLLQERRKGQEAGFKDIHEDDREHYKRALQEYEKLAEKYNWTILRCSQNGQFLSREQITDSIMAVLEKGR